MTWAPREESMCLVEAIRHRYTPGFIRCHFRLVTGLAPASRTHIIAPENAYFPTSLFTGPLPSLVIPKMPDYIAPVSISHGKVVKDTKPALINYVAAIFA